jgi:HlyD family secretion protein
LTAPFDGTVASIGVSLGEMVQPGEVVLVMGSLDRMQIETTDLSERDIARVRLGQTAHVQLKAVSDELMGHVIAIDPRAGKSEDGDTIFKITIALDQQPSSLRWGMTGDVGIDSNSTN